jgi:hypothetical protein
MQKGWVVALLAALACSPQPLQNGDPAGSVRLSFFALGDTGQEPVPIVRTLQTQMRVARVLAAEHARRPADALLLLGDNFYPDGLRQSDLAFRVRENVVRPYCAFLSLDGPASPEVADACPPEARSAVPTPLYAVLGNHDTKLPESPRLQRESVPRFVPSWRMPPGSVEVVELLDDALVPSVSLILYDAAALADAGDVASLQQALVTARGPFRILVGHYPISEKHPGPWIRRALDENEVPVHLHLAGHDHNLQVGIPPGGDPGLQIVAGSGGETREVRHHIEGARFAQVAPGFARVDLVGLGEAARLVVTLVAIPDRFAIDRAPSVAARYAIDLDGHAVEEPVPGS